ncbi:MAG: hypothetical protein PWP27_2740 [Clostridiales bacterium]|jgi:hypothetical protein|nr:hypothetical protein [Clostridiales bacterium]MDK2934930.1 hypothetical protein [Clostridiales bacterium]
MTILHYAISKYRRGVMLVKGHLKEVQHIGIPIGDLEYIEN